MDTQWGATAAARSTTKPPPISDTVLVAAITALAGLGSAGIGAHLAHRRTQDTFAHERGLRDQEHVREGINAALNVSEDIFNLVLEAATRLEVGADPDEALAKLTEALNLEGKSARANRQLMFSLHRHDQLVEALDNHRRTLGKANNWLSDAAVGLFAFDKDQWKSKLTEIGRSYAAVIDLVSARVGTSLADDTAAPK